MINVKKKVAGLLSMIMLFTSILSGTSMTLIVDAKKADDAADIKIVLKDDEVNTENVVENLEGTIENIKEVENITYQVYSKNNEVTSEGNAKVEDNKFVAEDVKLQDGENKVIFTVEDIKGNTATEEMKVTYDAGKLAEIPEKNLVKDESGEVYVNNTLLISFHLNVSEERREEIIESVNGTVIGKINAIKCYQVQIKENSLEELKKISKQLMKNYPKEVMSAKYDSVKDTQIYVPDDPFDDGKDWTEESPEGNNWGFEAVQMASAWEKAEEFLDINTGRFQNVKTGVVDDGFDMFHEDLGHVTTYLYYNSESIPQDHGSHTSGIVGAQWNNGKGIAGACQSDMVLISTIDGSKNLLDSYLTQGLVAAVTNGAKVINYSIGARYPYTGDAEETANMIASLYVQGYDFIYVQAAGNNSYDAMYNGSFCSITKKVAEKCANSYGITANDILKRRMVVAAVGQNQKKNYEIAKFSNYGTQVDICAPGVDIYSLVSDGKYEKESGTSMAAPFVTGIAGLVWAVNDNLTGPEVRDIICNDSNSTVTLADRDNNRINMINAKLCVEAAYEKGFHIERYAVGNGTEKTYTIGDSINLSVSAANSVKYTYEVREEETDKVIYKKENVTEDNIAWIPSEVGNYKVIFYAYDENGTCAHKTVENIRVISDNSEPLEITSFAASRDQVSVAKDVELSAEIKGGKAPYTYRFGTIFNGKTYYSNGAYITDNADGSFYETNKIIFQPRKLSGSEDNADAIGLHTLFVEVKDSNGKVRSKKIKKYRVNGLEIKDIKTSIEAPQTVGTSIELMAVVENDGLEIGGTEVFSISKKGGTEKVLAIQSGSHSATWTPEEAGYYTITYQITDALGQRAEKSILYRVKKEAVNETVIYYAGYDTPYIHYKVGNHAWTAVPGMAMDHTNEVQGYYYKAVIPLGTEQECTVCFNDGKGNWDSNNGKNYSFGPGTYGYKDGVKETFEDGLKLQYYLSNYSKYSINAGISVYGGKAPYTFEYKCYSAEDIEYNVRHSETEQYIERSQGWVSVDRPGTYYVTVTVTDSDGKQISETKSCSFAPYSFCFTTDAASPQKVGTSIRLTAQIENMPLASRYEYTTYFILKDGQIIGTLPYNCSNSNIWTPTEAGKYTIFAYFRDAAGDVGTYFMDYEIKDEINNQTTIYYKGYNTPYIHYKVDNGEWTTVPGKPMIESDAVAGYTHEYTIDLNEEEGVMVCFNNGNGSWDSNNGSNYKFGTGYYTYQNGKITKIEKPVPIFSIKSFDLDTNLSETTRGRIVKLTGTVQNNKGTVSYKYAVRDSAGTITDLCSYRESNNAIWQPSKTGNYTLIMYAKDSDGTEIQTEKNMKVNEQPILEGITFDKVSPQEVGTTIRATVKTSGGTGNKKCLVYVRGGNYQYTPKELYFKMDSDTSGTWIPDMDGNYTVYVTITDDSGFITMMNCGEYVVEKATEKSTTIYYNGYNTPYIHYMIDGSSWTTVPGVRMEESTEVNGYTHKITIPLGNAEKVTVCFNNGNNSWDSRNGQNYTLKTGVFGIKNQTIYELGQ